MNSIMSINDLVYGHHLKTEMSNQYESSSTSSASSSKNSSELDIEERCHEDDPPPSHSDDEEVEATSDEEESGVEVKSAPSSNQMALMQQLMSQQHSSAFAAYLATQQQQQQQQAGLEASEKENAPICKYCNKQFANFSNLNHHVSAIHLNQSKWSCSECGKICSSKSNLKVHLRVHLRVKPYHCRWCTYSCMHHSSIRDHLAKVHPDRTHTPLQPGYLFNSQAVPEPDVFNSKGFSVNSFVSGNETNISSGAQKRPANQTASSATPQDPTAYLVRPKNLSTSIQATAVNSTTDDHHIKSNARPTPGISSGNSAHKKMRLDSNASTTTESSQSANTSQSTTPNQLSSNQYPSNMNPTGNPLLNPYMASMLMMPHSAPYLQLMFSHLQQQQSQHHIQQSHVSRCDVATAASSSSLSNSSSDSDHHNLSYSTSSRSSSLSPNTNISYQKTNPTSRKTFNVDQMLNNSEQPISTPKKQRMVDQETQTDSSCLNCPYCSKSVSKV